MRVRSLSSLFGVFLASIATAQTGTASVDPAVRLQKWDGWGTSIAWWGHVIGGYPSEVREDLMTRLFTYLRLNVVRYNIGGGEDPTHHHIQPRALIPGYLSADGKWDWTADETQRWVLTKAKQLGANRFESFSNSPPYWMTMSKCAAGNAKGEDNLEPSQFEAFANYLAEVNEHFRTHWGIRFDTLEPINEPSGFWWKAGGNQEGCHVSAGANQSALIEALGKALATRHSRTDISASDENDINTSVHSWDSLTPAAKDLVRQINTHHYGGSKQTELHDRAVGAKKRLWMSEEGDGDGTGMVMAERIVKDLRDMQPSAWVYWQAIDQYRSRWGFIDMDLNSKKTEYVVNPKFYVMASFSRFIRPGSVMIGIDDPHSIANLHGSTLTVVSVNHGDPHSMFLDLSKFGRIGSTAHVYRSSSTDQLVDLGKTPLSSRVLNLELPKDSVSTIVVEGCH